MLKNHLIIALVSLFMACALDADLTGVASYHDDVNGRFSMSETWNATHPAKNIISETSNYQILVAADSHIGGTVNFSTFAKAAKNPENMAAVLVGDVVTGKSEDYDVLTQQLSNFGNTPYFMLIGNHDLYFDGWQSFLNDYGTSTFYFTVQTPTDSDLYICLDSGSGTLGYKQLAWLKNNLESLRSHYRNCTIFSHVNLFRNRATFSTNLLVTELTELLELFSKYKVNMVVMGHDHKRAVNEFGNTTFLTLDALADFANNASYAKIKVIDGKLSYEFVPLK